VLVDAGRVDVAAAAAMAATTGRRPWCGLHCGRPWRRTSRSGCVQRVVVVRCGSGRK
jgi:hypothetical protein